MSLIDIVGGFIGRAPRWQDAVRQGAVFRRESPTGAVEIARVLDVAADPQGISHVRYAFQIAKDDRRIVDERRTLNLESFHKTFGEPVETV